MSKRFTALDIVLVCLLAFAAVFGIFKLAETVSVRAESATVSYLLTGVTEGGARAIRNGDAFYFDDGTAAGTVSSVQTTADGIVLHLDCAVVTADGRWIVNDRRLLLGGTYTVHSDRFTGTAICTDLTKQGGTDLAEASH